MRQTHKLFNTDNDKGKFKSFANLTKQINNDNDFLSFTFSRPYNIFLVTFIMFNPFTSESDII